MLYSPKPQRKIRPGGSARLDSLREQVGTNGFTLKVLSWAGASLIYIVGLIHLVGEHFAAATYRGLLFLANFAGAMVAALGLYLGSYRWA